MSVLEELGLPPLPEALPRPVIDNHTHVYSTRDYSGLSVADNLWLAGEVGEGEATSFDTAILLGLRNPADLSDPLGPGWLEEVAREIGEAEERWLELEMLREEIGA